MGKLLFVLFLALFLSFNVLAEEEPQSIELPAGINLTYPGNWKVVEEPETQEILRLGDERNNALFSIFLYEIEGTTLEAFAEYMVNHFSEGNWEKAGELEEHSWEGIEEGLVITMETGLGEDDVLKGHYLFFRVENRYFLGRFVVAGQVWEEYEEDWIFIKDRIKGQQD